MGSHPKTPHRPPHRFKVHGRGAITGQGDRQLLASHSSNATHKSTSQPCPVYPCADVLIGIHHAIGDEAARASPARTPHFVYTRKAPPFSPQTHSHNLTWYRSHSVL